MDEMVSPFMALSQFSLSSLSGMIIQASTNFLLLLGILPERTRFVEMDITHD